MGDVGDVFNALRAENQERRAAHAAKAPEQIAELQSLGHTVRQLSHAGPHLRIDGVVDYWASTGRWRFLKGSSRGRGYNSLKAALAPPKAPQTVVRSEDGRSHRGRRQERAVGSA
jgi:hypothetical protein